MLRGVIQASNTIHDSVDAVRAPHATTLGRPSFRPPAQPPVRTSRLATTVKVQVRRRPSSFPSFHSVAAVTGLGATASPLASPWVSSCGADASATGSATGSSTKVSPLIPSTASSSFAACFSFPLSPTAPLFRLAPAVPPPLFLGGLLGSALPLTLLEERAGGRIMRARTPASGGLAVVAARLAREAGRGAAGAGPSEGRLLCRGRMDALFGAGALDFRSEGPVPVFAAEAAVGAVRCDGSGAGRVGDLGAGLWKPPGEVCVGGLVVLEDVGEAGLEVDGFAGPALEPAEGPDEGGTLDRAAAVDCVAVDALGCFLSAGFAKSLTAVFPRSLAAGFVVSLAADFAGSLAVGFTSSLPAGFVDSLAAGFVGSLPIGFAGSLPAGASERDGRDVGFWAVVAFEDAAAGEEGLDDLAPIPGSLGDLPLRDMKLGLDFDCGFTPVSMAGG